nr:alveolar soft part sarcoma chromosome [Hymenolepis microstoma]
MASLSVRYPTGHLDEIPVVPTEPIIKVLEAACVKRSLDPKLYKLVHNKRTVDLSVPFRLSGLANRATLELVPCDQATVSNCKVRIGVRLQNGYRAEWNGMSDSTIWSVLESLASKDQRIADMLTPSSDDSVPTIMYLQNYFGGEENLRHTTLNSLGIRDSALFQLMRRQAPPPTTEKESKASVAPKSTESKGVSEQSTPTSRSKPSPEVTSEASMETPVEGARPQLQQRAFQQQRQQQQHLYQGESVLNFEPFSIFGNTPTSSMFDTDSRPSRHSERSRPRTVGEMIGISLEPDSRLPAVPSQLQDFKFPSETEGQNLMYPKNGSQESEAPCSGPCDREEKIFVKEIDSTAATTSQDDIDEVPDQYFELSRAELQKILADLRKVAGTDVLLGEQTAQQKAAQDKLLRFFPRCVIRFIWSDNVVLQACFRPLEPVSALYNFIRERLVDQGLPFYLFTAPPRVILSKETETLFKSKLHPSAKIYFSVKSSPSKGRDVLKSDLLERIAPESETEARGIASKWMPNSTQHEAAE